MNMILETLAGLPGSVWNLKKANAAGGIKTADPPDGQYSNGK